VKSNIRGKVKKYTYFKIIVSRYKKDTDTILKILLSRDTNYRFVSLSIYIVWNRKIRIVNRKILTSMMYTMID
jgi:hypothetical protein